jgi:hypothetical protein
MLVGYGLCFDKLCVGALWRYRADYTCGCGKPYRVWRCFGWCWNGCSATSGNIFGRKKSCPYKDDLWTIKYLHKFKWHHLIEKLNFNKNLREKRIKNEIRQGKRENEFMLKMYEKSKMLNKKREKEENKINEDLNEENDLEKIRKKFKQKKPIFNNNNNNK